MEASISINFYADYAEVDIYNEIDENLFREFRKKFNLLQGYYCYNFLILNIDSPGGEVRAAFKMFYEIEAARKRGVKVHTRSIGDTSSAAFLLFMAGEKQILSNDQSKALLHKGYVFFPAQSGGNHLDYEELKKILSSFSDNFSKYIDLITKSLLRKIKDKEIFVKRMNNNFYLYKEKLSRDIKNYIKDIMYILEGKKNQGKIFLELREIFKNICEKEIVLNAYELLCLGLADSIENKIEI